MLEEKLNHLLSVLIHFFLLKTRRNGSCFKSYRKSRDIVIHHSLLSIGDAITWEMGYV